MQNFYSRGKLLLTGEYVVLDGALALALPTKFGQSLKVQPIDSQSIFWKSIDEAGNIWFENEFNLGKELLQQAHHDNKISNNLMQILGVAKQLNPEFLISDKGFEVTTKLEFPRSWGLGSSSTLINNIADWANVDAYKLLAMTFGGSGYDIACAQNNSAITYQLKGETRQINQVDFNPEYRDHLFFIHLNKKQDSRKGVSMYNSRKDKIKSEIKAINHITINIINCSALSEFETLIAEHEKIISEIIKIKPVKETVFNDYKGAIKSLGAWGGDFILATGNLEDMNYFRQKGYPTIVSFENMIL